MNMYGHGVQKNRVAYIFQNERHLMSTGTLLTSPHCQPTFWRCCRRWKSSCAEQTVILDEITQDNNNVLGDDSNDTFKLRRLESSMEEAVSTFHSLVELIQQNGGPQQKLPLAENENPASRSNQ